MPIFRHLWFLSFLFRRYIGRKCLFLAVFGCVIYLGFTTISWFTMNTQVESGGMSLKTQGLLFTIQPVPSPYVVGIYDDSTKTGTYVRNTLLSGASKDSSVLTWTITNDTATTDPDTNKTTINKEKNIGNGPAAGYEATSLTTSAFQMTELYQNQSILHITMIRMLLYTSQSGSRIPSWITRKNTASVQ